MHEMHTVDSNIISPEAANMFANLWFSQAII